MNPKKILKMAKKLQKITSSSTTTTTTSTMNVIADKGHFFVYTLEKKRFMVPLAYLESTVFQELLKISEEEFGLSFDGPITLPCDAVFMEYVLSSLGGRMSEEAEREIVSYILANYSSSCTLLPVQQMQQQPVVFSF
ncbi:auxin-responsive protein SAUR65-like [Dioscorea cayenensis subsp. rotundata]|uniref:Auxin-responsive protein SAUR65-like n=1 Tax=Dioscorea cayennensis subsp. rotundata TaxID=55577 RepID=A0AB40C6M7_DIOCR|nr:auxin-responsive protein SAUR65-like [Dioscorea cayenensis subsp. rotundata]